MIHAYFAWQSFVPWSFCISYCAQKFLQLEIPMHLFGWVMESRDGRSSETSLNLTDSFFFKALASYFQKTSPLLPNQKTQRFHHAIISHLRQVLPESIGKLHQLQHLDVSHNCLMMLPKVMDQCLKAAKPLEFGLWSSCLCFGLRAQIRRIPNLAQMLVRIDTYYLYILIPYTAYHSIPTTSLC